MRASTPVFEWLERARRSRARSPGRAAQCLAAAGGDDHPRRPGILRGASAVPHGRHPEWPSLRGADRRARPHARRAPADCKFVGVHLASLEWDVDRIARVPAPLPAGERRPRRATGRICSSRRAADHDKVRRFFIEFQDRILYGSRFRRAARSGRRRIRRRSTRGLARRLAIPGRRRFPALRRIRGAVSRARAAARR